MTELFVKNMQNSSDRGETTISSDSVFDTIRRCLIEEQYGKALVKLAKSAGSKDEMRL